jgi:hypothetical protein
MVEYDLLKFVTAVDAMGDDAPLVWSVSYGDDENDQVSTDFMLQCNLIFQKLGLKGISLLVASGDQSTCGWEGCGGWLSKKVSFRFICIYALQRDSSVCYFLPFISFH